MALTLSLLTLSPRQAQGRNDFPNKESAWIVVSQDEQQMLIYEGNRLVRTLPISSGWPGLRKSITPVFSGVVGEYWGSFNSFGTWQDHGYYLFTDYLPVEGDAFNLPGWGDWNGDVLLHSAPYLFGPNGEKQYIRDGIGKTPVSNGCIRMQPEDMEWFAQWDPVGVAITIKWFSNGILAYPKLGYGAQLIGEAQNAVLPVTNAGTAP
jgi:hypothetical protein